MNDALHLSRLLEISGPSLSTACPMLSSQLQQQAGHLAAELSDLLRTKNGFYAFESALHVFPSESNGEIIGLDLWNASTGWRSIYGGTADGCFFAEDVFGGQFVARQDGVHQFDPETGRHEWMASSLEAWAGLVLRDYEVLTGFPLAHEWQLHHGVIPPNSRLVPKIPFVLGGEYRLENLHVLDALKAMKLRGNIAMQIRDLPDGSQVRLEVDEK